MSDLYSGTSCYWNQFWDPSSTKVPVLEDSGAASQVVAGKVSSTGTPVTFTNFFLRLPQTPALWDGEHIYRVTCFKGREPQDQPLHIKLLEMKAVTKPLQGFSLPLDATVLVSSDNSTVISYFKSLSVSLCYELELLFQLTSKLQISLQAVHI